MVSLRVGSQGRFYGRRDMRAVLNAAGSHRYLDEGRALSCTSVREWDE